MLIKYLSNMDVSLVLLGVLWTSSLGLEISPSTNLTNSTNDMYVIHATVYQVGIITNKSDDEIGNMTGNQEALSFYHSNGTVVDLSDIPTPLMTNVTAQSTVAVAPVHDLPATASEIGAPVDVLELLTTAEKKSTFKRSENFAEEPADEERDVNVSLFRRSTGNTSDGPTIKVFKETSLIPPEAGLKSIGLPDLVGFNTSMASIPLPIPNTSVVRYAKISTLVKAP